MRSAVFYGEKDIRIEEKELRAINDDEVLIEVKMCGVCGTDVHIYNGAKGSAEVPSQTVLGHEFSGMIKEIGNSVTNFKVGDKVCVDPNCYCGVCKNCKNGLVHYCSNMDIYGITEDGGFQDFCIVKEKAVYKLGNKTSYKQGAMVEPLGCCIHGIDMCNIIPGSKVVIIGAGMIGLLMVQLARLKGASKVIVVEPIEEKRLLALEIGADIAIDITNVKKDLTRARFDQIDTIIECVGKKETVDMAVDIATHKSLIMLFGLTHPDEEISIKPFDIFRKELTIKSSFINPKTHQRALDLIDSGKINVNTIIKKIMSLNKLNDVLNNPELRSQGKILISPSKK